MENYHADLCVEEYGIAIPNKLQMYFSCNCYLYNTYTNSLPIISNWVVNKTHIGTGNLLSVRESC